MSDDLIKRSDAIKAINSVGWLEDAEYEEKILAVPTIEPKRGEWKVTAIKSYKGDILMGGYCSVCGYENCHFDYNFCPNCGADMREREGE